MWKRKGKRGGALLKQELCFSEMKVSVSQYQSPGILNQYQKGKKIVLEHLPLKIKLQLENRDYVASTPAAQDHI